MVIIFPKKTKDKDRYFQIKVGDQSHEESLTVFTRYFGADAGTELPCSHWIVTLPLVLVGNVQVEMAYTNFVQSLTIQYMVHHMPS